MSSIIVPVPGPDLQGAGPFRILRKNLVVLFQILAKFKVFPGEKACL